MCKEYNGYTNYQTWNIQLWIDNDEGSQQFWTSRAADLLSFDEDNAKYNLEQELIEYYKYECNPLADKANVYSDLLGHALSCVNWFEIADNLLEYAAED